MRIAIVNDTQTAIEALRRALLQSEGHELAWIARTGAEAVRRCASDTPDLVLMDLIMPEMDGVEATRRIMAKSPCAIVVVTVSVRQNSSKVFAAMGAGALDAVNTPTLVNSVISRGDSPFLGKIETIHRLIRPRPGGRMHWPPASPAICKHPVRSQLVAIGASAGGPVALAAILSQLPEDVSAAVIVVQHVDRQFAKGLADWLGHQTALPVRLAQEGDQPQPGVVFVAGAKDHLAFINPGQIGYLSEPAGVAYRPSIDIFFKSVQQFWRGDTIGVLLTGMGRDGAEGLKILHRAGSHTITQDRATSTVFGMPKAAAELDAASEVLPLHKIGARLTQLLTDKCK